MKIFNIIKEENPELWTEDIRSKIYEAAFLTYNVEEKLINRIFSKGDLPNLTKDQVLNYMSYRINMSMQNCPNY